MNRDMAAASTGTATHDMSRSLASNLWLLLPPAAALFYPQALRALYESGKLLARTTGPAEAVAWFAIFVSVALVYSVPAVGICVAYLLGRHERTSSSQLLARRIAHLAVASPPLFVLIGVVFLPAAFPKRGLSVLGDPCGWPFLRQLRGLCARETPKRALRVFLTRFR